jgi:signal transduction histidine kinase
MSLGARISRLLRPFKNIGTSFSMRFALVVSLTFTIATLLAGAISFLLLSDELNGLLADDARRMTDNLVSGYQSAGLPELQSRITSNIASNRDESNLFLFMDADGKAVTGNFSIPAPFSGARELVVGQDITLSSRTEHKSGEVFQAWGAKIPTGWIITARDTQWVADSREVLLQSMAWALASALVVSIVLAFLLARRVEARLSRLSRVLGAATAGDLSLRYRDPGPARDDISRVARQVNQMLDRLSQSMASLRQVSTDVAHDLRAPLTRLRTQIEPHYQRTDLPPETRRDLNKAMSEMDTITAAFDAVLRLAQIESRSATMSEQPVDLAQICQAMFEMLEPVAAELGHDFQHSRSTETLMMAGDRDMLSQGIVNLIENAFRHCPAPARLRMSTGREGRCCLSASATMGRASRKANTAGCCNASTGWRKAATRRAAALASAWWRRL